MSLAPTAIYRLNKPEFIFLALTSWTFITFLFIDIDKLASPLDITNSE
jgi:hypothetical protein